MSDRALTTVEFLGATLWGVRAADRDAAVGMKALVEGMGLAWAAQFQKLKEHPVLAPTIMLIEMVGEDGKLREAVTLPLRKLPFWLATIQTGRIPDVKVRERVVAFQQQVCDVLEAALFPPSAAAAPAEPPKAPDLPWAERPPTDRRLEIDTARLLAAVDSPERALWYVDHVARIPGPPRPYKRRPGQPDLLSDPDPDREIMVFNGGNGSGEAH